jgi:hypothetical protein
MAYKDPGYRKSSMKAFDLYWGPEGRKINTVYAQTMRAAIRKAPKPYRRYLGEIYAVETNPQVGKHPDCLCDHARLVGHCPIHNG